VAESLVHTLLAHVEATPDRYAYRFVDGQCADIGSLTFGAVDAHARAVAHVLEDAGARGQPVLLVYPPGLDYIVGLLGCFYAGAIAVPIFPPDPSRPQRTLERLSHVVADCGARVVLTQEMIADAIEGFGLSAVPAMADLAWTPTDTIPLELAGGFRGGRPKADDVALIQYTSGSTGDPKGAVLDHGNLVANAAAIRNTVGLRTDSRAVCWVPPYHDMGLFGAILLVAFNGHDLVYMSPLTFLERPMVWLEAIAKYRGTCTAAPNFAFDLCVRKSTPEQRAQLDLRCVESVVNGAEPVRKDSLDRFCAAFEPAGFDPGAIVPCYGLAEATLMVTGPRATPQARVLEVDKSELAKGRAADADDGETSGGATTLVSCGRPVDGLTVAVVDSDTSTRCPDRTVGEIWIAGTSVSPGYWHREGTFDARLPGESAGFFRTGDLGFFDAGELFVTGRIKDLIIVHGRNLYPHDLERTAEGAHPLMRKGCCAAVPFDRGNEETFAIVAEVKNADEAALDEAIAAVRAAIVAQHDVGLGAIELVPARSIPKTSSGKLRRRAVRSAFLEGTSESLRRWPSASDATPAPKQPPTGWHAFVIDIWAAALERPFDSVGVDDDFFALGGDSLAAAEVNAQLRRLLGRDIADRALQQNVVAQHTTARALAKHLRKFAGLRPPKPGSVFEASSLVFEDLPSAPLLPLQQSFVLNRELGDSGCYAFVDFEIAGPLDRDALAQAIGWLPRRHGALRLSFERQPDGLRQVLGFGQRLELTFHDFSDGQPDQLDARLSAAQDRLTRHGFDSAQGEMMVAELIATAESKHRLLLAFDHLAVDGQSVSLLVHDLLDVYAALAQGRPVPDPAHEDQHRFLSHAAHRIKKGPRADDVAWWRGQFERTEAPPLPEFPPELLDGDPAAFEVETVVIPQAVVGRVHDLARDAQVTFFSALFAAFAEVVAAWTATDEITVLTPHRNRRLEAERDVGCFTDIIPLRIQCGGDAPFTDRATRLHGSLQDALAHSSVSAVELARMFEGGATTAISPVIFSSALFPDRMDTADLGLEITPVAMRTGAPSTLIDVIALERGSGELILSWNYRADTLPRAWIRRLATQLADVLDRVGQDARLVECVGPLAGADDVAAYRSLNATDVDHGPVTSLHAPIFEHAAAEPDAVAVIGEGVQHTYAQLATRARGLASVLATHGVGAGTPLAVIADSTPELPAMLLGVLAAGGAYVPVDPDAPDDYAMSIIRETEAPVVVMSRARAELRAAAFADVVVVIGDDPALDEGPSAAVNTSGPDDPAYIIYTSGSTGRPKGAVISHRAIHNRLAWMQATFPIAASDRVAQKTRQSFDVSVWELFWPLWQGATMVVLSDAVVRDPSALLEALREHEVSITHFVPAHLQSVLQSTSGGDLPALRWLIASGEALPPDLVRSCQARWPQLRIANLYGPTEAAVDVTAHQIVERLPSYVDAIPIGQPVSNTQVVILDPRGALCGVGVTGEICLGGVQLATGYVAQPERTAAAFIRAPASYEGAPTRLYRTGDLGLLGADGRLHYVGRRDHQVKIRGMRVELGEIEARLRTIGDVAGGAGMEVAVIAAGAASAKRLVAFVVVHGNIDGTHAPLAAERAAGLRAHLEARVPPHMVPTQWVAVSSLPRTSSGKLDRRRLSLWSQPVAGGSDRETEGTLRSWVANLAGLTADELDVGAPISQLGVNSLLAVELVTRVRTRFGAKLSVREILQGDPTLRELEAQVLLAADGAETTTKASAIVAEGSPLPGGLGRTVLARLIGAPETTAVDPRDTDAMARGLHVTFRPPADTPKGRTSGSPRLCKPSCKVRASSACRGARPQ